MLQLPAKAAAVFPVHRRYPCMPEGYPVLKYLIDQIGLTDSPASIDCDKFSFITVIQSVQLLNFSFPAYHRISLQPRFI